MIPKFVLLYFLVLISIQAIVVIIFCGYLILQNSVSSDSQLFAIAEVIIQFLALVLGVLYFVLNERYTQKRNKADRINEIVDRLVSYILEYQKNLDMVFDGQVPNNQLVSHREKINQAFNTVCLFTESIEDSFLEKDSFFDEFLGAHSSFDQDTSVQHFFSGKTGLNFQAIRSVTDVKIRISIGSLWKKIS